MAAAVVTGVSLMLPACDSGPTAPRTGSLTVSISNLPSGIAEAVTVQGAVGTSAITVSATRTIADLEPGVYTVTAVKAVGANASYAPSAVSQTVEVAAGSTPATVSVGYTLSTGIVKVTINGLPSGSDAAVTLFNNAGFFVNLTATREVGNLEPGDYTLQVERVIADEVYAGTPLTTTLSVTASTTPVEAVATYLATTGSILLSSSDVPAGATPTWDLAGPNGYTSTVRGAGTQTLSKLTPGPYTITARNFDFGAETYGASSQSISVTVTAGTKAPAVFAYVTRPPTMNLTVEGAYITQSSQRFDGSVPLVEGRAAFLRVFLKANELNSATPKVRVRLFRGAQLFSTAIIDPPAQSVGTSISERTTADSWGLPISASEMTAGLAFIVDADPDNSVREVNESDNTYPASGIPLAHDIRSVPTAELRFVPIETSVNSLIGNVNDARVPDLLSLTLNMFPLSTYSADVRAPFSTSAPALERDDANGSWVRIINELNAVRVAEGSQRIYLGILRTPYSSGIVGLGFLPGKTLLSWDAAGAAASSTIAHELGHNWGREHAPCGNPAKVDQSYPYPNARIGVYGFDVTNRTVLDAERRDVMSYCSPEWVSDYTYRGIMNFRGTTASSVSSSVQSTLIVWGRMVDDEMVLEPAFMADTRPALPAKAGRYRVEGFDATGSQVFSISFDPERVGDADAADVRQFAFAVPVTQANAGRIVSMRLTGNGREARLNAASATGVASITASAVSSESVRLTWNSTRFPMLVVRDPDTKEILALARDGSSSVRTRKKSLEISASNRVASSRLGIQVQN